MGVGGRKTAASLKRSFNAEALPQQSLSQIIAAVANDNIPVRKSFNEAVLREHLLEKQPSLRFEVQAGLSGICGQYIFPEGIQPFELEEMLVMLPLQAEALPLFQDIWRRIELLNPVLGAVAVQKADSADIYHALLGVTSGFNIDDINFYLDTKRRGLKPWAYSQQQPHLKKLYDDIQARACLMLWVAAPETLEKIKAQMDKKQIFRP